MTQREFILAAAAAATAPSCSCVPEPSAAAITPLTTELTMTSLDPSMADDSHNREKTEPLHISATQTTYMVDNTPNVNTSVLAFHPNSSYWPIRCLPTNEGDYFPDPHDCTAYHFCTCESKHIIFYEYSDIDTPYTYNSRRHRHATGM